MSVRNINDFIYGPVVVRTAGQTIHVGEEGSVIQDRQTDLGIEGAIIEDPHKALLLHRNTYIIDGWLAADVAGVYTAGSHDNVTIGATGRIDAGFYGVWLAGDHSTLSNKGEISGSDQAFGVLASAETGSDIRNNGLIVGDIALALYGSEGHMVNGKDGVITGDRVGVEVINSGSEPIHLVNHGVIVGSGGLALQVRGGVCILDNDGKIKGDILLGDGGGTLDTRHGVVRGGIVGGAGNDTLITDDAKYHLTEGIDHGTDTVKSTVSYTLNDNVERLLLIGKADTAGLGTAADNVLKGNAGNNSLNGLDGADILDGGKGSDVLFGGVGSDVFRFATGDGKDTIKDFSGTEDVIDLHGWSAIDNFSKVLQHATDHGANVWITAGHDTLVIDHVHKTDLIERDFVWVMQ